MPVVKVMLQAYCNAMAWNPREPYHFVCANEDSNLYSFDMRKLDRPTMIHKVITNVFVKREPSGSTQRSTVLPERAGVDADVNMPACVGATFLSPLSGLSLIHI